MQSIPRLLRLHPDELRATYLDDASLDRLFVQTHEAFQIGAELQLLVGLVSGDLPSVSFDSDGLGPVPSHTLAGTGCILIRGSVFLVDRTHPAGGDLPGIELSLEDYDNHRAREEISTFLAITQSGGPTERFLNRAFLGAIEHEMDAIVLERLPQEGMVRVAPPISMQSPARTWLQLVNWLKVRTGLYHQPMGESARGSFVIQHHDVRCRVSLERNPDPTIEDRLEVTFERL